MVQIEFNFSNKLNKVPVHVTDSTGNPDMHTCFSVCTVTFIIMFIFQWLRYKNVKKLNILKLVKIEAIFA